MRLLSRLRRPDLWASLQREIDAGQADGPDWVIGLQVACEVERMEATLAAAGLGDGVEPVYPSTT